MNALSLPILLGTSRQGRESEKVARLIERHIREAHPELRTELFDVRTFDLPPDDEGTALAARNPHWRDAMQAADGLIVVTPEYNHGYPGSLKRALDVLLKEYVHKPVGFAGVSAGWGGGQRVIESLLPVARELGLAATFSDLYFPRVGSAFDEDGTPTDAGVYSRIDDFLAELSWMATALRWGRESVPSKFDSV